MTHSNPFIEAVKEACRLVLLAIIPLLIGSINPLSGEVMVNWQMIYGVSLLTLLRFTDKFLHELGKETGDEDLTKGITRF